MTVVGRAMKRTTTAETSPILLHSSKPASSAYRPTRADIRLTTRDSTMLSKPVRGAGAPFGVPHPSARLPVKGSVRCTAPSRFARRA